LQNIAKGSKQKIYLNVYSDGVLTQATSIPTLSIYDADDDTTALTGYSNITVVDENTAGVYSYTITPALTQINRVLKFVWSYSLNSVSTSETQLYDIETTYSTVSEIQDFLGFGSSPSEINYKSPKEIESAEKIARTIINGYTGQKFIQYYGQQEQFGFGSDALELVEKMVSIDKLWENDELLIDNTITPVYNNFGFPIELSPTKKAIRIINVGWDLRYDNQVDPTAMGNGRFRDGSRYKFQGIIGWKYVPEDIKIASMLLVGDILANDYNWRNKYLKKVNLSEISFEMAGGAFNGTGNVTVDNILDQYRNVNIVII
jgi:hypothetical protein